MTDTTTPLRHRPGDVLMAVVFAGLTQVDVWVFSPSANHSMGTRVGASVFAVVACAALVWRRSRPVAAFWTNWAAVGAIILVGLPGDVYQWTNLIAVYSFAAHGASPQRWLALPAGVAGVGYYFVRFPFEGDLALAAFVAVIWVVGWLAGRIYGGRLDELQLRREVDLARRLAEANERRLALEEERMRIARELHDIVGHTVNVMVVHAGAGRREVGGDQARVRQAFDIIERTGRAALSEMDRVLALLRGDAGEVDRLPAPSMAGLAGLAATFDETGLKVEMDLPDAMDVPASAGVAVYRIVQEALTNVLRHADATRAVVTVRGGEGRVEVAVADDGVGDPETIEDGRGISGMRERAGVHGGTVTIDRSELGGIAVRASLSWEPDP